MKWKNIIFNATLASNCLLCFLLVFYDRLTIPAFLQVAGRAHPLVLHFPIVLFVVFLVWTWLVPASSVHAHGWHESIASWLLLSTAFTAVITALLGVFLSREQGYAQDALVWHKWSGTLVSILTVAWYAGYGKLFAGRIPAAALSIVSVIILLVAGHQGASITHGDNYLLAPVETTTQKKIVFEEATIFQDMVKPILDEKCLGCHNSKKSKGDLIMETSELLTKGGRTGILWDTTEPNLSLILQRIHLAPSVKKHMPPEGKPQLNDQEMAILYNWIKLGARFNLKVSDLQPTDTLRIIAGTLFKAGEEDYNFSAASEKKIKELNTNFRVVYPLAKGSPALAAEFYGAAVFKPEQLSELLEIKNQLVSLNLEKMPVKDEDLKIIGQFTNLRKLQLSFTQISGSGLASLNQLNHLRTISLSNTGVKKEDLRSLGTLKELHEVYVWNSNINHTDAESIRKNYPRLKIQTGARTDTMFLKINPPVLITEANVIVDTPIRLVLKHFVPGTVIRYTLDGTDPDSTHSNLYDSNNFVDHAGLMKARAFKKGWHESEPVEQKFYKATYRADTIILLQPADSNYRGKGGRTLNDFVKGSQNFGNGQWLGFRKNNAAFLMVFPKIIRPGKYFH